MKRDADDNNYSTGIEIDKICVLGQINSEQNKICNLFRLFELN